MTISSPALPSVPMFVADTGHGKLAAFVDLATEDGRARLRELVRDGDVFVQGYRQGAMERHGFGPVELAQMRPGIVVTAITATAMMGRGGRGRLGTAGQTVTGMAVTHGGADGPKTPSPAR